MPLFLASKSGGSGGGGGGLIILVILAGGLFLALGPYKDDVRRFYAKVKERAQQEVFSASPSIEKMVETERAGRPAVPKDLDEVSKRNKFDKLTKADRQELNDLLEKR